MQAGVDGQVRSGIGAVIDGCDGRVFNRILLPAQTERLTRMNDGQQARSVERGFCGREGVFQRREVFQEVRKSRRSNVPVLVPNLLRIKPSLRCCALT